MRVASWKFFLLWKKETEFFSYFSHESIFYSAELFVSAFNFNFCWTIFSFLNKNTNQKSKELDLNFIKSSYLFLEKPCRGVLEVNCQACNFIKNELLYGRFREFWSHFSKLVKKFTKILEVGKIFRRAKLLSSFFRKWQNLLP